MQTHDSLFSLYAQFKTTFVKVKRLYRWKKKKEKFIQKFYLYFFNTILIQFLTRTLDRSIFSRVVFLQRDSL